MKCACKHCSEGLHVRFYQVWSVSMKRHVTITIQLNKHTVALQIQRNPAYDCELISCPVRQWWLMLAGYQTWIHGRVWLIIRFRKQALVVLYDIFWLGSMYKAIAVPELPNDIWWVVLEKFAKTTREERQGSVCQLLQIMLTNRLFKQLVLDLTSKDVNILLESMVGINGN